ncbi:FkbM family methyltransferase [Candidatus Woesebacteria bacterium]|nr:FkbM family methyltransferase [Candidatus Woesebacteria bacterium]
MEFELSIANAPLGEKAKDFARRNIPTWAYELLRKSYHEGRRYFIGPRTFPHIHRVFINGISYQMEVGGPVEYDRVSTWLGEKEYVSNILDKIKPMDNVYDIGAYTGSHSLAFAMMAKYGNVYSFDPDPFCITALRRNLELNQITNVKVFNIALWDTDTCLELHADKIEGNASRSKSKNEKLNSGFSNKLSVRATTIKTLIKGNIIPHPDIVKIDVEGVGLRVLQGMGEYVSPKHIFVEIHPEYGEDPSTVYNFLACRGYRLTFLNKRKSEFLTQFNLQ